MFQKGRITDFFKPFAYPPNGKRPRQETESDYASTNNGRSPSKSPRLEVESIPPEGLQDGLSSSMISSLTPLSSSDELPMDDNHQRTNDASFESHTSHINAASDLHSSFTAGLTSSQRIVKNGQMVVTNSDGESDSDTSLGDIDELLTGVKQSLDVPPSPEISLSTLRSEIRTRQSGRKEAILRAKRGTSAHIAQRSNPPLNTSKYKFSIDSLIAQVEKEDAAEAGALQARLAVGVLNEEKKARDAGLRSMKEEDKIEEGLLTSMVEHAGNIEGIDRLVQAVKRTEALHQDKTWLFFDFQAQDSHEPTNAFPEIQGKLQKILSGKYALSTMRF